MAPAGLACLESVSIRLNLSPPCTALLVFAIDPEWPRMTCNASFLPRLKVAIVLIAAIAGAACANPAKPLKKKVVARVEQTQGASYATRPDAMAFADDLASRRNLDPQWVREVIG